ncbi:hypothetical protein E2542_SST31499 [Spatholobus suberectus]|nr:hypothetical protein E2542_SST31499 [Spatholobus suberectus]
MQDAMGSWSVTRACGMVVGSGFFWCAFSMRVCRGLREAFLNWLCKIITINSCKIMIMLILILLIVFREENNVVEEELEMKYAAYIERKKFQSFTIGRLASINALASLPALAPISSGTMAGSDIYGQATFQSDCWWQLG